MSKWKCEICGSQFENFHAQGFDNKIYCPLCYFKKLSADLQVENSKLKEQLDYLRSGEYYNQLRFENEMLQQVVDTNGIPSEIYDFIDCTHRNTELLEENKQLKDQKEDLFNQNRELRIKLEHSIPEEQYTDMLYRKNKQLQQRQKVIEKTEKLIKIFQSEFDVNDEVYKDMNFILDILNKYKKEESE